MPVFRPGCGGIHVISSQMFTTLGCFLENIFQNSFKKDVTFRSSTCLSSKTKQMFRKSIRKVLKFEAYLRCWTPRSAKTPTVAPNPTGPASSFASGSSMCVCCGLWNAVFEDEFPLEKGWFLGSILNFRGVFLKVMVLFAKMFAVIETLGR